MVNPKEFKEAFESAFIVNRKHLLWDTMKRRTAYMTAYIYRTVADCFPGINIEYEFKDIDAVLYKGDIDKPEYKNIEVAIEHENDVATIGKELTNFQKSSFPSNVLYVLITYTGNKIEWILKPHSKLLDEIKGPVMFIIPPENCNLKYHKRGSIIKWKYLLYENNGFIDLDKPEPVS